MGVMNVAEIMDRSVEFLKKNIKTISLFSLAIGIIMGIIAFVVILVFTLGGVFALRGDNYSFISILTFGGLLFIIVMTFFITPNIGFIKISSSEFLDEKVYTHNAINESFKNIFKVLGFIATSIILFSPVAVIFGGIFYYFYKIFDESLISLRIFQVKEKLILVLAIIIILLAIFVILSYITILSFSLHAITIEKKGVFASLKRSYDLVKSSFWKIFGCMVIFHVAVYGIRASLDSFIALVMGIIFMIMKFLNIPQDYTVLMVTTFTYARWPLNILSWLVISPIASIMMSFLYFNQRFKKEGFDIILKLKEVQKNEERK